MSDSASFGSQHSTMAEQSKMNPRTPANHGLGVTEVPTVAPRNGFLSGRRTGPAAQGLFRSCYKSGAYWSSSTWTSGERGRYQAIVRCTSQDDQKCIPRGTSSGQLVPSQILHLGRGQEYSVWPYQCLSGDQAGECGGASGHQCL